MELPAEDIQQKLAAAEAEVARLNLECKILREKLRIERKMTELLTQEVRRRPQRN